MPRRTITIERWQKLADAFRTRPGAVGHAAKTAGVDIRTARRAWYFGLTTAPEGCREPLQLVLEREQVTARARLEEARNHEAAIAAEEERKRRQAEAEKARRDATDSRVEEAKLVRAARGNAFNLMVSLNKLSGGVSKMCQALDHNLTLQALLDPVTGQPHRMTQIEMRMNSQLLATVSTAIRQVNDAAARAIEMERVLLGEPTHVIGVQVQAMTYGEMARTVELATLAMDRARGRGLVVEAPLALGQRHDVVDDQSKLPQVVELIKTPRSGGAGEKGQDAGVAPASAGGIKTPPSTPKTKLQGGVEIPKATIIEEFADAQPGVSEGAGEGVSADTSGPREAASPSTNAPKPCTLPSSVHEKSQPELTPVSITGAPLPVGTHPFPSDVIALGVGARAPSAVGRPHPQAGNLKVVGG